MSEKIRAGTRHEKSTSEEKLKKKFRRGGRESSQEHERGSENNVIP